MLSIFITAWQNNIDWLLPRSTDKWKLFANKYMFLTGAQRAVLLRYWDVDLFSTKMRLKLSQKLTEKRDEILEESSKMSFIFFFLRGGKVGWGGVGWGGVGGEVGWGGVRSKIQASRRKWVHDPPGKFC